MCVLLGKLITISEYVTTLRFNYSVYHLGTRETKDKMLWEEFAHNCEGLAVSESRQK